jgi:hypothetical protein
MRWRHTRGRSLPGSEPQLAGLRVQRVEQGGPGDFAKMSDEELEAYVYGDSGCPTLSRGDRVLG